jgi:hypothetical protein
MAVNLDVPQWLDTYVRCWRDRFNLQDWTIEISLAQCVDGNAETRAQVSLELNIHHAAIVFRADIEDTPEWQRTVIHEVAHIKHETVDQFVFQVILPSLDGNAYAVASRGYRNAMEQHNNSMTWLLWRLAQATDDPEPTEVSEVGAPSTNGHKAAA